MIQLEFPLIIFDLVECSDAGSMHHLRRTGRDRNYSLRVVIYRGPKLVGKRYIRSLHTKDPSLAMRRRDAVLLKLQERGLLSDETIARMGPLAESEDSNDMG